MRVLLVIISTTIISCSSSTINSDETDRFEIEDLQIEELRGFLQNNYSEYRIVTSPIKVDNVYGQFLEWADSGYDFILTYDLDANGYLDYFIRLYQQTPLEEDNRYESVVEVYRIWLFGSETGLILNEDNSRYSGFAYNGAFGDDSYSSTAVYGILPDGDYTDWRDSSFTLTKPSLGIIGPASYVAYEWFSPDSSTFYVFWSD